MPLPALLIPFLASLASAGIGAYNTNKTAKRQDSIAADGIRKQAETQRIANARLNKTLDKTAGSRPDEAVKTANASYIDAIQRNMAGANAGLARRGISAQFDQLAGESSGQATDYAGTIAGLLSRIDGGTMQRQQESNSFGDLGMDLGALSGNIHGDAFLNNMALNGVRRNPYLDLLSGAVGAAGSAYGAKGGGKATMAGGRPNYGSTPRPTSGWA